MYKLLIYFFSKKNTDALKLVLKDPPYNASDSEKVKRRYDFIL